MKGYIYKITNDINDKIYIGKTLYSIEKRWKEHCMDRTKEEAKNRPLYKAMNKYGKEHFHIEVVEECDEEILSMREIYWIETYHSYSNGYNATLGGDGMILYNHDKMIALYEEGLTCKKIAEKMSCCIDVVQDTIRKSGLDIHKNAHKQFSKITKAVLKDGTEKFFKSNSDAARWLVDNNYTTAKDLNGIIANIGRVANGKQHRKSYLGIKWFYVNE